MCTFGDPVLLDLGIPLFLQEAGHRLALLVKDKEPFFPFASLPHVENISACQTVDRVDVRLVLVPDFVDQVNKAP